jgi:hypothetical protein
MSKKATSVAEKRKFAEENGYIGDINTVNNKAVPREVLEYTRGRYQIIPGPAGGVSYVSHEVN